MAVYETRPELEKMCREVILKLYEFIDIADSAMLTKQRIEKIRNRITKKYGLTPPRNIELVQAYNELLNEGIIAPNETILNFIIKRKVRTLSGIANITVMLKAFGCPGQCIFCPTQEGMPKSYFSTQPAMLRAVRNNFDAYSQVKARLNGLKTQGHDITKIDIRTAGGTWSSYIPEYQEHFIKSIYFALNEGVGEPLPLEEANQKIQEATLEDLIKENETTTSRCVGLWVETRPDWVTHKEINKLRRFGVTGIELGIQTTDDKVNEYCKRGHGMKESEYATKLARDAGLKICHHLMPNLPTATIESDLQSIKDTFLTDKLQPDYIKIYPCMVVPTTELYDMYQKDKSVHTAYTDDELIDLLIECKKIVPEYCRIIRILRDFPSELVIEGSKTLNLRQIIHDRGVVCKCVRCREIKGQKFENDQVKIRETWYEANQGTEVFIQAEEPNLDKLIGLVRLRMSSPDQTSTDIPELQGKTALIRELHVYGQQKSLKKKRGEVLPSKSQHQGFGKQLMKRAEEIASEKGFNKIAVISAIGTREYYKKLGYHLEGTYMVKEL